MIGKGLEHFNGTGGFNGEGEYEIRLAGDTLPPAPWINVIGNPVSGCLISEVGSSATWASNSSYRLTPWQNDPVEDPPGECIYIRDHDNGDLWTATPEPIREQTPYTVRHGAGYSVFEHEHEGIATSLRVGVPKDDPLKIGVLTIVNSGTTIRRLHITSYVEWLLGADREKTQQHIRTKVDEDSSAMLARSCFDPQYSSLVAFTALSDPLATYTAARREFIGRNGTLSAPAALSRNGMTKDTGDTIDPCAAMQVRFELAPGATHRMVVLLGACDGEDEAMRLIADTVHRRTVQRPLSTAPLGPGATGSGLISVKTPEPTFDRMLNGWTLYQALSCRMWARAALYQWSGAYGFRDQLQDVMAFCVLGACAGARAHSAERVATVRGRRCSALVASAERSRNTHPFLGRPGLASVRRESLPEPIARHRDTRRESLLSPYA